MAPCIFKKLQDANKMKLCIEIFKSAYSNYIKISKSNSLEGRFPLTFKRRLFPSNRKKCLLCEVKSGRKCVLNEVM